MGGPRMRVAGDDEPVREGYKRRATNNGLSHEGYEKWHLSYSLPSSCSGRVTGGGGSPHVRAVSGDSGRR